MEETGQPIDRPNGDGITPKSNRGRFTPGDVRINRAGRPRIGFKDGKAWDRAPRADCLKLLRVPARKFLYRFSNKLALWIVNFPPDMQIVACHFDAAENVIILMLRSSSFPRIARGAVIPQFAPEFTGASYGCGIW